MKTTKKKYMIVFAGNNFDLHRRWADKIKDFSAVDRSSVSMGYALLFKAIGGKMVLINRNGTNWR